MGILGLFWISAVDKARLLKECVAPDRKLSVLGALVSSLGKGLNSTYGLIVIRAIGGDIKK